MPTTVETEERVVTVQVTIQRIGEDGYFHCDVNPADGEASWMLIVGGREVHLALCSECMLHFETAVVK